ncbi:HAD family hydrolase [Actinophytocola algeriensis]|uniref:Phosphoglycolate phosphatase-like HAD superfamily hydrolase n=1 Tax=Actinophytocola algeriensis TaxID=1768010 RepID=A0A7W7Q9G4_9PSEU|nr:HAD family hydrolase [Actinophytocola algeriensis]MBB4909501.1 phosphoglycolate phosphatase-like HAD superfamily hydrolase [Actinophytocola algeriensis]MBE1475491.1 phosphoglycolate phosphatase-like HAD superfamily hydrolase [Actinophytocola algeriensis]
MLAEELLAECDHVLLAFDGPVAELPTVAAADRLRTLIADEPLPREVARTGDPFVVLAHAATIGPATGQALYDHLCRVDFEVVGGGQVAEGVHAALATLAATGTRVTVVSGLHSEAVRSFLVMHGLDVHVRRISARTGPDPAVLPPAPDLVTAALGGDSCVFIGTHRRDLAAAAAAGVSVLRHQTTGVTTMADPNRNPWFASLS